MKPKFVKINPARGYGNGMWLVVARKEGIHPEYTLENPTTKERKQLYVEHTYEDFDTKLHTVRFIQARAAAIGSNDNGPKKKRKRR